MLEYPEILTITQQMQGVLPGKKVAEVILLSSPHKFAFLNHDPERYTQNISGQQITGVRAIGNYAIMQLASAQSLVLGDMGGRILFHADNSRLPEKHQLLVRFADSTYLTATIQMWGAILLLSSEELARHSRISRFNPAPLDPDFTFEHFKNLVNALAPAEQKSIKYFIISQFGLPGVGNGCLHDILFNAGINPKTSLASLTEEQLHTLWQAARETLQRMVSAGGRSSERNLFDRSGGYTGVLSNERTGQPCPVCGTPIERITYLGGASFYCPRCQPLD